MIEVNKQELECVKLSVRGLEFRGVSVMKTLVRSVEVLCEYYENSGEPGYLYAAVTRIQAYLEIGFSYESEKELFDRVLILLGTSRKEQFPRRTYAAKDILLTRPQIRRLIKPWSSSKYHTMPIDEVPDDIIDKVLGKKIGRYEYHSNANPTAAEFDYVYILFIDEEESYIYNVQKGMYYRLMKPEAKDEDSNC
ncbi:MAG: hypothetical protein IJZ85_03490 [Lachnospiraceae bacterium]|nr:hypothetical protein [Lachnospiraceae bacterium]